MTRIVIESKGLSAGTREPITVGVPFPRAACRDRRTLRLTDASGKAGAIQTRVLQSWPDGSIKWALIDFQSDHGSRALTLCWDRPAASEPGPDLATAERGVVQVDTGAAQFIVSPGPNVPFASMSAAGRAILGTDGARLAVQDASGRACSARIDRVSIEEPGALRTVVLAEGVVLRRGRPWLDLIARMHFFAGCSAVRLALTLRNPRRAVHRGGFWELGDAGSILLRDVTLRVAVADSAGRAWCSPETDRPCEPHQRVNIYQDSSGGANWASRNHVNRDGHVPNRFRGYRMTSEAGESSGLRATPLVAVEAGGAWAAMTMPRFWENFPKAVEVGSGAIALGLWPGQYADVHELQGGEQKTHTVWLAAGPGALDPCALEWCRQPSTARCEPSWYCASGVVPYLVPAAEDPNSGYLRLVEAAVEGPQSFAAKREVVDEFGWRHFGDIYADHETAFHEGPEPLVSHYNNQYDALAGFAYHFMRTGDTRWWTAMDELAAHVVDIDIYHTTRDRAAYNNGLFWHTYHYTDADRATHRCYARSSPTDGGGPSNEHNYTTGLLLHHLLTGSAASRDAALGLARWVIAMDDGRSTILRWFSATDTGLASATYSADHHGPGRGAANSINALLDGHRATGEREFLDKAERLIRRCIHPRDNVDARNLLNVEGRWSYTVFLQGLGRYLDYKRELGEHDAMMAYARESLLAYARWMCEHEVPYLSRPDVLQYPNETWTAQDIRKSDALAYAAAHAEGSERERFLGRSRFFFEYSTSTLLETERRTRARPLVLMLVNGFMHAVFRDHPPSYASAETVESFGAPEAFVPQKQEIARRIRSLTRVATGV